MRRAPRERAALPRALVRSLLAFVASFVAVGYFATISHMAFVAHAICAEHGELVHVETAPAAASSHTGDADSAAPRAVPREEPAADEHDHCVLGVVPPGEARVAAASAPIVTAPEPLPAPPPVVVAPSWAPAPVPPPPPIAILLLSPKSSPPA